MELVPTYPSHKITKINKVLWQRKDIAKVKSNSERPSNVFTSLLSVKKGASVKSPASGKTLS